MPTVLHDRDDMVDMREAGYTYEEIAKEYGISRQRTHKIIGPMKRPDAGGKLHKPPVYKGLRDWLQRTHHSARWLAIQSGISVITMSRILHGADTFKKTIDAILAATGLTYEEAFGERVEEKGETENA